MYKDMELEYLSIFVSESREMIEDVEPQLIIIHEKAVQTGEIDIEAINTAFRLFHTLKGSAASLALNNITSVTHKAETLLELFRSGKAKFQFEHVDLLMRTLDLVRSYLDLVADNNSDKGKETEKEDLEKELSISIKQATEGTEHNKTTPKNKKTAKPDSRSESESDSQSMPKAASKIESGFARVLQPDTEPEPETLIALAATSGEVKGINSSMQDVVEQFIEEAIDILDTSEKILLELEKSPDDSGQMIRELFRGIHSFKGNCGFLGLAALGSLSHKTEAVLELFLENAASPAPEHLMTFLIILDSLRHGVSDLASGGKGSIEGLSALEGLLEQMKPAPVKKSEVSRKLGEILLDSGVVSEDQLEKALAEQHAASGEAQVDKQGSNVLNNGKPVQRSDIRVDLNKLDKLINLVGELVIAETMVTRNPDLDGLILERFGKAVHHLRRVTSELQDVAMSVRMIPLSMTFQKLVRVVHDLAHKENKMVKLDLIGEETEVDKTMTELIADPLLHMVRNSVDHGLETAEERLRLGKPETGKVTIESRYEGGEVWIVVSDDGRGLDREKIISKASEKGLLRGDATQMSDEAVFNLIFEPGFSTSDVVSEVSGRGVGMDVVKRNIEKLKGRTSIKSKPGVGTSIYLQIPLTLAIIDGMMVRVGETRYTIPLLSIRESIRPKAGAITVTPDREEILRIREDLIPVIRLHQLHGNKPQFGELIDGILVVVEDQGRKAAIFIDEILGQQQTVIKGLSSYLSMVKGVSGCTILGDGAVSLILDIGGLIEKAAGRLNLSC